MSELQTFSSGELENMISEAEKRLKLMDKLTELSKKEQEAAKQLDVTSVEQMQSRIAELEKKIELMDKLARLQQTEKSATSKLNEALSRKEGKRPTQEADNANRVTHPMSSDSDGVEEQTSPPAKKAKTERPPDAAVADSSDAPKPPGSSTSMTNPLRTYCNDVKLQLKVYLNRSYYHVPTHAYTWPRVGEKPMFHVSISKDDVQMARDPLSITMQKGRDFWCRMLRDIRRDPKSVVVLKGKENWYSWYILLLPKGVRYKDDDDDSVINTRQRIDGELVDTEDLQVLNMIPIVYCNILMRNVKDDELWKKSGILEYARFGPLGHPSMDLNPKTEGWEKVEKKAVRSIYYKSFKQLRCNQEHERQQQQQQPENKE